MKKVIVIFFTLFIALSVFGEEKPDKNYLKSVTERGRQIAEYDAVIWQSSDALKQKNPAKDKIKQYVAKKVDGLWYVAFGKLSSNNKKFSLYAEAVQSKKNPDNFRVKIKNETDESKYINEARAFETAYTAFSKKNRIDRKYNVLIVPTANKQFYVYLVPASLKKDVYPLGGDTRFLLSSDGSKIIEEKQLHRGILEVSTKNKKFTRSFSILSDTPVDTDIYHIIIRKPRIPHFILVLNKEWVYKIDKFGKIKFLGKDKKAFGLEE